MKTKGYALLLIFGLLSACGPDAAPVELAQVAAGSDGVNAVRRANSRSDLRRSNELQAAANAYARELSTRSGLSHTGRDGSSVGDRARRAGYAWCFVAENIARGQRSREEVLTAWMNSPGHRRNLLSSSARDYGFAQASGDVWVMVLGSRDC